MHPLFFIAALQAPAIVVTGSREPVPQTEAPVSATILDDRALDALAFPLAADALRLVPGLAVSVSGPRGTQTQVRIRGAEANHSLLFIDGIRFNDPAAGNEARFELLATDLLSRVEIVRGPQSALWGSEALGGVIAAQTADPFEEEGAGALAEYGSLDSFRASAQAALRTGDVALSATGSLLSGRGIDSFGGGGERDGSTNRSAGLRAVWRPAAGRELGVSAFYVEGESEFDGFDPATFRRADTLDATTNRIAAARGWVSAEWNGWTLSADTSLLDSANRNRLGDAPLNRTAGRRITGSAQLSRRSGGHRLTAAVHREEEDFRARDQNFFGGTDQDRSRSLTAFVGEWHAAWSDAVVTDLAVRHDGFSAFRDATTIRAAAIIRPGPGWTVHGAYGEGIAQPTFFDLYGFFPGSFVGNPALTAERSRGWEAGLRRSNRRFSLGATAFSHALTNEIVEQFGAITTTRNVAGASRRRGIELHGEYLFSRALQLHANYTLLDAGERREPADAAIREIRRPRHSANLIALGEAGRLSWSASLAYVGARTDDDFDTFQRVRLDDYVLGSARVGWRLRNGLEAYARVENAFDADYQDVVGYNTAGRTIHAGLRLRLGR
ncbi:MAG: vitamin transporter [Sphingomonadales bacterium]|jgi:vitamin B12 transporter|nr:vitamin transporter [Sphingomonadales bacterium]